MAFRLKTISDVRRYLANLINRVERGVIPVHEASKRCYCANTLLSACKEEQLDKLNKRLEAIEEQEEAKELWRT